MPLARPTVFVVLALALAGGCDYQSSTDYLGEPLAVLRGEVASQQSESVETNIVLLWDDRQAWQTDTHNGTQGLEVRGAVQDIGHLPETEFPTRFSMRLYVPPPMTARAGWARGHQSISIGRIAAASSFHPRDASCDACTEVTGLVSGHVLVFVSHEDSVGEQVGSWFQARDLEPGFHLMAMASAGTEACPGPSDCLLPSADGLDTPIVLEIGVPLGAPSWGNEPR